jgi:pSer/pThr/pTyr-binding forkhead associated (FHA) protein
MLEVILTYPTPEGSKEIRIESERTSFGRGSDATVRFADDGLSRLHATVYREGDRVWIVDENSSNGTFVNGQKAAPAGTPLRNGDEVRIGNHTVLSVHMRMKQEATEPAVMAASAAATARPTTVSSGTPSAVNLVAVMMIGLAFMVVSVAVVFVGYKVFAGGTEVTEIEDDPIDPPPTKTPKDKDDKPANTTKSNDNKSTPANDTILPDTPDLKPAQTGYTMPAGKTYLELSDSEKRQYLSDRALRIAQVIGNSSGEAVPADALDKIKGFTEGYARRAKVARKGGKCGFGDNLEATYERASKNAPFIVKAFNAKATDPRIGLYLAMIESEHCVCLQSPTGPLGMFQFTQATGKNHGLNTRPGASPENPDERCEPEPAARAAASYMKSLTGRYGTGPSSVPLAIGSYNSGEGGLSSNLVKALESNSGLPRDFWTLIANGEKLSKQFQSENFKYVPKFFAAAIIGENPQDFGLKLRPLSTYTE